MMRFANKRWDQILDNGRVWKKDFIAGVIETFFDANAYMVYINFDQQLYSFQSCK